MYTSSTKRVYLSHKEFAEMYHMFLEYGTTMIMAKAGLCSFYIPSLKTKFILEKSTKDFRLPDGRQLGKLLSGEAARATLEFYNKPIRKGGPVLNAPFVFSGAYLNKEMSYYDVKACYYQLYRRLWTDVGFPCINGTDSLRDTADYLQYWKKARNSVPGLMMSDEIILFKKKRKYIKTQSKFFNPCLWSTLNATLHELSNVALRLGAVYIATDGFFFLTKQAGHILFEDILKRMKLEYHRIIGVASLVNWQHYAIIGEGGEKVTKPYKMMFNNPQHLITKEQVEAMQIRLKTKTCKVMDLKISSWKDMRFGKWITSLA